VVSPRVRAYAIVVGVFLVGGIAGAAGATAWTERRYADLLSDDRRDQREARRLRALSRELELSPEQEDKVRSIMQAHRDEHRRLIREMFEGCGEPVRKHKAAIDAEIRPLLRPAQQKRFAELAALHRERFLGGKPRADDTP
jgi:hypothetical protein